MTKIVFLKRAVITLDDGQIIYGQEGQIAELDGEQLDKALDAGDVDLAPDDSEDAEPAAAEPAAAKSKK